MSITLETLPYPHPVSLLALELYGQDVRMAYMDVAPSGMPNGKTVFLFHGANFFGEYWATTIEVLSAEGYRVVVPDQIGFGRSSKPLIPYNFHDMAANTRALMEHLGIDRAAVVGHSMGGMLATRFAFAYPDVTTHVILVNQIGLSDARTNRPWRYTEQVYQGVKGYDWDAAMRTMRRYFVTWKPEYEKYARIHYGWTLSADWPRFAEVRARVFQMIYADPVVYDRPHVEARTLVVGGAEDGPNFRELARAVADAIPNSELVLFDNVGHNPHLEAPERLFPELIRFLATEPLS